MTLEQEISAHNLAFKCLQMAALSEQDGNREKADRWRKKASKCFCVSARYRALQNQLYISGIKKGNFRVITGGKLTKP